MTKAVPKQVLEELATFPVFSGCTERELRDVAGLGTTIDVDRGYVLTRQGRRGFEFFVVLSGTASCHVDDVEVARFTRGDFFGEMGLLDREVRSATVVAETPMKVLVVDSREFGAMLAKAPSTARKLLQTMSVRLRSAQAPASVSDVG